MPHAEAIAHLKGGRPQAAVELLEPHLRGCPADARAWFVLGACRHALSELSAAADAFGRSLRLDRTNAEVHLARVAVLREAGDLTDALAASRDALEQLPGNARVLYATALCLEDVGRTADALTHYEEALRISPKFEDALHNRGLLLVHLGRLEEAEDNQRRYIAEFPLAERAHRTLVDVLIAQARYQEALDVLETVDRLSPNSVNAQVARGVALSALRKFAEARTMFAEARARHPEDFWQHIQRVAPSANAERYVSPENLFLWQSWLALGRCDWSSWGNTVSELQHMSENTDLVVDPAVGFLALHLPLSGRERHAAARRIATGFHETPALPPVPPRVRPRLRIGIISPDLRDHVVGHMLLPLFELLDRERFDLYAYSLLTDDRSELEAQFRISAPLFRDLSGFSDGDAAARIREDDIDILIDAAGYTTGSRFGITSRRPGRLQISYLGYIGSLGSERVDHVISDQTAGSSPGEWSEVPISLPHTYCLYDFRGPRPGNIVTRQHYGLPDDAFVYCAFHKAQKISPDAFDLWMRILGQVSRAVLWLQPLSTVCQRHLEQAARARGVDPIRLVFVPFEPKSDPRYISRHLLADLMLDTLYHNAIATACDAMAAGLPVLTIPGDAMASRAGASLARAAGVPEMIARDKDDYVEKAVFLAENPEELRRTRQKLLARTGPLFDTAGRVRELEQAFLEMWRRYEQRQ